MLLSKIGLEEEMTTIEVDAPLVVVSSDCHIGPG